MDQAPHGAPPALRLIGIGKRFGDAAALNDVSLTARSSEIHALLGANGAGKSTLLDLLLGLEKPSAGTIEVGGKPLITGSIEASQAAGIAMITEDVSAIPTLTVAENVLLNREPRNRFGFISRKATIEKARALLAENGVDVPPDAPFNTLGRFQRQQVAMVAAMVRNPAILLLDSLPEDALRENNAPFFAMLRRLRDGGRAILIVSDRMDDLYGVADRATILRDGYSVAEADPAELSLEGLASRLRPVETGPAFLEVQGVAGATFSASLGQVIGLSGRADARAPLIAALTGTAPHSGLVRVGGAEVAGGSIDAVLAAGIHPVPTARIRKELELRRQVAKESRAGPFGALAGFGQPSRRGSPRGFGGALQALHTISKRPGADQPLASGLPLADGEPRNPDIPPPPRVLVFDHSTADVGLGTRAEIAALLRETAQQGHVVLLVSDEPLELLATCDRLIEL